MAALSTAPNALICRDADMPSTELKSCRYLRCSGRRQAVRKTATTPALEPPIQRCRKVWPQHLDANAVELMVLGGVRPNAPLSPGKDDAATFRRQRGRRSQPERPSRGAYS